MGRLLSDQTKLVRLLAKAAGDFPIIGIGRPRSGYHYDVVAPTVFGLREPISLPYPTADAIPNHCMANLGAGSDAQPVVGKSIFPTIDNNTASGGGFAPLVQTSEQMILF